jgi:predicted ATP-dependent serine protease
VDEPRALSGRELATPRVTKVPSDMANLDELLEGGFVLGATYLIYGQPGSRKTTLCASVAQSFARARRKPVLYVSSEQRGADVRTAAERVRPAPDVSFLGIERQSQDFAVVRGEVERLRPCLVVYDSIQEFGMPVGAVLTWAKGAALLMKHTAFFVSQVNRQGRPAGPRRMAHWSDDEMQLGDEGKWVRLRKSRHVPAGSVELAWPTSGLSAPATYARASQGRGPQGESPQADSERASESETPPRL